MKISAIDEYGLRIILRIAREGGDQGLSIPQLSEKEVMSQAYAGKIARQLRIGGLIRSNRGQKGGYVLARPAEEINILEVIQALDGPFFDEHFCAAHSENSLKLCTHSVDCSIRSLWTILQSSMNRVMENLTLADLMQPEAIVTETIKDNNERSLVINF